MEIEKNKSTDSLYLDTLKYQGKDGQTWLNFFIKNFRVTVLIVIGIIIWGIISLFSLPQESMPEVKIPYGFVTVMIPGASPEDMEEMVVKKIENKIQNLSGVKTITSTASNSFAVTTVEFNADQDIKDAISRLREAAASAKSELPQDASDPNVKEVSFTSTPVWTLVITGPYDSFTLRKYAEMVQEELKKLPGSSEVTLSGGDIYEIQIAYDPAKLEYYGVSIDQINGAIKANNFAMPLGSIKLSNYEYTIKATGKLANVQDLRNLPITTSSGQTIKLSYVANVVEMAQDRKVINTFSLNGKDPENAITINVIKKTGSSILDLKDNGQKIIDKMGQDTFPKELKIATIMDQSQIIRKNINQLAHDGITTVLLVFTVIFLFVGLKEAFVAGLAVPLVFCVSFGVMYLTGITLNFLSLFSLILSLGLLVDDAIVVVQATKQYLATGKFTPEEAVLLVFRDYKILLTTTTLTTIWAFIPLLLASGIIGSFIRSIPITVSITLAASYFIAIIINHPMAIILERFRLTRGYIKSFLAILFGITLVSLILTMKGSITPFVGIPLVLIFGFISFSFLKYYRNSLKEILIKNEELILEESADPKKIKAKIHHHYLAEAAEKSFTGKLIGGIVKMDKILPAYGNFLTGLLTDKKKTVTTVLITIALFFGALSLPVLGLLKSEFLPQADNENMYINIEGPPGLTTTKTKEVADKVAQILLKEKNIKSFSLVIGAAGVNISDKMGSGGANTETNRSQFAINLVPLKERTEESYVIAQNLRKEVSNITGAKIEVAELKGGPPTGSDISGTISGDDMLVLEQQANKYKTILSQIDGVINPKTSITLSPGEFSVKLNYDQMNLHGVTTAQVSSLLRTALSSTEITKILQNNDEITVRANFEDGSLTNIDQIKALKISNARGQIFSLSDIADISLGSSLTSISRIDGKRIISLSASVEKPHIASDIQAEFQKRIAKEPLPKGYEIKFGGLQETNAESIYSILKAMILAMILIVGTLVLQFNSFTKAIMILTAIPFAVTGVFYGFTLMGFTLSFPALIGIVALFGVVVKNAVILVDKINLNLRVGIPFIEAIVDAAKSRLEAIFLTSTATVIGMIPITLTDETWAGMGAALIFGLSTSTLLTLIVLPILFKILNKKSHEKEEKFRQLKKIAENLEASVL